MPDSSDPHFSILIATRHPQYKNNINQIIDFWKQSNVSHEIIVYSPESWDKYDGATTVANEDANGGDFGSSVFAYNFICPHAKGEYCIFVADYVKFVSDTPFDPLSLYGYLKENNVEIATLTPRDKGWVRKERFDIETQTHSPNVLGESSSVCIFPVVKNEVLKTKLDNCVFHPKLIHHYCDHYLTFYAYKKLNIIVNQLWDFPIVTESHDGRNNTDSHDLAVLLDLYSNIDNVTSYTE